MRDNKRKSNRYRSGRQNSKRDRDESFGPSSWQLSFGVRLISGSRSAAEDHS
jgi:hypothetical protein